MKPEKRIEERVRGLRESAGAEAHERILGHLLEVLNQRKKPRVGEWPTFRRTVMRNPITRWAAAAVLVAAVALFITFTIDTTPRAYGLDQTIEANLGIRSVHVMDFDSEHEDDPKDFWITCDEQGQIENVRCHMPTWASPDDGAKTIVWSQGVAKVWFHRKNSLLTIRDKTVPTWMSALVQRIDPRYAVERLRDQQQQGKLALEIDQPRDKGKPIVVTATYPPTDSSPGRREVLHVDQATSLVIAAEFYRQGEGDQYTYQGKQEYHDYNVPIADGMFTLDDEVPADVIRVDQVARDVGLVQGAMTDEQVAMEVVRQFFEAIKARDYEAAGILMGGLPAQKIQEWFGQWNIVRVVSVGEPTPPSDPRIGGFAVPCEIELQNGAGTQIKKFPSIYVRPVDPQTPNRWNIHGGL